MANKNTRALRVKIAKASKNGEERVEVQVPVKDYHNDTHPRFNNMSHPTAVVKGDGFNSFCKARNSCQRVYKNKGNDGRSMSVTVHEPFLRHEPMGFPNHRQYNDWEYRRPGVPTTSV